MVPSYASGASAAPLVGLTVGAALDAAVAAHGSGRAVVSPAQRVRWTYDEFGAQVDALAAGFLKLGLVRGDRCVVHNLPALYLLCVCCLPLSGPSLPHPPRAGWRSGRPTAPSGW